MIECRDNNIAERLKFVLFCCCGFGNNYCMIKCRDNIEAKPMFVLSWLGKQFLCN